MYYSNILCNLLHHVSFCNHRYIRTHGTIRTTKIIIFIMGNAPVDRSFTLSVRDVFDVSSETIGQLTRNSCCFRVQRRFDAKNPQSHARPFCRTSSFGLLVNARNFSKILQNVRIIIIISPACAVEKFLRNDA